MKPYKLKQSLAAIRERTRLPFLAIHYSRQRKHARIVEVSYDGQYTGYYLSTPTVTERWSGDAIEWILLATLWG